MRGTRAVLRSMVTPDGCLTAMDDGSINWRPRGGGLIRARIEVLSSVLLGLKGPTGHIDRIVVGDRMGGITILSISDLSIIDKFMTKGSPILSLCSSSMSGESILAGCKNGQVFLVGANIPGRVIELFELEGPASALRVIGQNLHIQQGWERKIVDWKGKTTESLAVV